MREKFGARRPGLLVLMMAAFVSLVGASDPLNRLVVRTDRAQGPVPAECETGLSLAPAPRVDLTDVPLPEPEPSEAAPPPSAGLRATLDEVQTALAANNRPAFDDALARARSLTEAHPAGGERRAAEELVRIYDGTRRLWDAQFESPFFAEDSAEYAVVSAYPGYAEAMRRNTITDASGRRFYPAAESRIFLTGIAADRLKALGVRSPARATQPRRSGIASADDARPLPAIRPQPAAPSRSTTAPRSTTPSRSTSPSRSGTSTRRGTSSGTSSSTAARPRPTSPSAPAASTPATTQTRKPAVATSTSSSPNPSTPPTTTAVPKPAAPPVAESTTPATASSPAAGDSTSPVAATSEVPPPIDQPTETATPVTDTTLTTAPPVSTTAPVPVPADTRPLRSRSVVLPVILILIGLAVLIVLFRASK